LISISLLIFFLSKMELGFLIIHSIRCFFQVWNLETLQCLQTLTEHTAVVMSVLCWDQFLISCSLDKTVKVCFSLFAGIYIFVFLSPLFWLLWFMQVWYATESGNLEVTYTHTEEHVCMNLFMFSPGMCWSYVWCFLSH
jgi:WD40 repeat protein